MKDQNAKHKNDWADTLPSQWGPEPVAEIEVPLEDSVHSVPSAASAASAASAEGEAWRDARTAAPVAVAGGGQHMTPVLPLGRWIAEGLRATLFLQPRTGAGAPTPWQFIVLVLLQAGLLVGMARLEVAGPAQFNLRGWLTPLWTGLVLLWFGWWAMAPAQAARRAAPAASSNSNSNSNSNSEGRDGQRVHGALPASPPSGGVAAWYVLCGWAPLVPTMVLYGLLAWVARQPDFWGGDTASTAFWVVYGVLTLWVVASLVAVSARFIGSWPRTAVYAAALVGVIALGSWQFQDRPWEYDAVAARAQAAQRGEEPAPEPVRLSLSQDVFEAQQPLLDQQLQALAPGRPGVANVYGLVFAPYAGEEVFRRESTMVSSVLQERFDAPGRVIHLLNHAETAGTHAWATPQNLQRAITGLAERMDRDNDILVIYMTSHGARNHELAASHWPLKVPPATPEMLRAALDEAGIRHRVIAVSACYSGGWIEPLANDSTLIMTAADATHTSYGCGMRSELTFFGRAVFHEQLRRTHSFRQAFDQAVPLIAQREVEAGKSDGFSNPQIHVGPQIEPVLKALEERLAAGEGGTPAAAQAQAPAPTPLPMEARP
ncbi:C13 family peptidase [Paracidovorax sp. MALMAid1276]|uniref:C13 family peptidase n=1 Tax=Paracidovorax sp. MALMAid1276 TaxID=3411631 RepID=UPI003B994C35